MLKKSIITIMMLGLSMAARAEGKKGHGPIPECEPVVKACEVGGFKPGMHKENGKGTWVDCVGKLAKGESVEGVTGVTKEDASKCLDARKSKRAEHKANKNGKGPSETK